MNQAENTCYSLQELYSLFEKNKNIICREKRFLDYLQDEKKAKQFQSFVLRKKKMYHRSIKDELSKIKRNIKNQKLKIKIIVKKIKKIERIIIFLETKKIYTYLSNENHTRFDTSCIENILSRYEYVEDMEGEMEVA